MNRFQFLFSLLLAMCLAVGVVFSLKEVPGGHGMPHGDDVQMLRSSPTITPLPVVWLGWAFGVLQIGVFITCMTFGFRRKRPVRDSETSHSQGRGLLQLLFGAGTLLFLGGFTWMVIVDREMMTSGVVTYLGPFPTPTTWMLFGLWVAPLFFVIAYVVGFSRWIIADDDIARIQTLVAEQQNDIK